MEKSSRDRTTLAICAFLVVATLVVYLQTAGFEFCYYDDNVYVLENEVVRGGLSLDSIKYAFTSRLMCNWHPLTWLSFIVDTDLAELGMWVFDADLGRSQSGYYHLTNVVLHAANSVVLFLVLFSLTNLRWRSAFVAALFALHPLHVESVAWIAERKDVLSTLFWFLTMWAYLNWVKRRDRKRYVILMLMFLLGLMSKPMLVTLPIVLLLMDIWPLRRYEPMAMEAGARTAFLRLIVEKIPLFALAAIFSGLALWAQSSTGAVQSFEEYPIWVRVLNAFSATIGYLWKMVWPVKLAAFYPHPGTDISIVGSVAAGLGVAALTVFALLVRRGMPYVSVGWLWYLITLLPVIGLVQIGAQSMADRYTYVPLVGIFIAIAWAVPELLSGVWRLGIRRVVLVAVSGLIILALIPVTYKQVGTWRSPQSLYGHAIAVTENNAPAHMNYGCVFQNDGDLETAVKHFRKALRIDPGYLDARFNLGNALYQKQDYANAERELKILIKQYPRHPYAHNRLGDIYVEQFRFDDAIRHYKLALRDMPKTAEIHNMLGVAYAKAGRFKEAAASFRRAIELDPSLITAQDNLDRALYQLEE